MQIGLDRNVMFELALRFCDQTKVSWAKEHSTWPGLLNGVLDGTKTSARVRDDVDKYTADTLDTMLQGLERGIDHFFQVIGLMSAFGLALTYRRMTKASWAIEYKTWPGLINGVIDGNRKSKRVLDQINFFTIQVLKDLKQELERTG